MSGERSWALPDRGSRRPLPRYGAPPEAHLRVVQCRGNAGPLVLPHILASLGSRALVAFAVPRASGKRVARIRLFLSSGTWIILF